MHKSHLRSKYTLLQSATIISVRTFLDVPADESMTMTTVATTTTKTTSHMHLTSFSFPLDCMSENTHERSLSEPVHEIVFEVM